jgi:transketolase
MINSYIIKKDTIQEAIDDTAVWEQRIAKFQELKPEYKCEIKIKKNSEAKQKWELHAKIWKDEQTNNKVFKEVINTLGVL